LNDLFVTSNTCSCEVIIMDITTRFMFTELFLSLTSCAKCYIHTFMYVSNPWPSGADCCQPIHHKYLTVTPQGSCSVGIVLQFRNKYQ
jgi:hypothetical protein